MMLHKKKHKKTLKYLSSKAHPVVLCSIWRWEVELVSKSFKLSLILGAIGINGLNEVG